MFGNPDYAGKPVQWGGQSFSDPGALSRWLRARGASPAIWAIRHPAAAQALGMAMPSGAPAAQGAQDYGGEFHASPMPQAPPFQGSPPFMPPAEGMQGSPQPQSNLLAAIMGALGGDGMVGGPGFAGGPGIPQSGGPIGGPGFAGSPRRLPRKARRRLPSKSAGAATPWSGPPRRFGPEGPGGNANLPINEGHHYPYPQPSPDRLVELMQRLRGHLGLYGGH